MTRKASAHVLAETREAEASEGLNAICADCGQRPGYACRKHFVARIEELDGHRKRWRRHAMALHAALSKAVEESPPLVGFPEIRAALAFELDTDGNGKDGGTNG